MARSSRLLIFLHSSDELYGADRVLLEIVAAVPPEVEVQVWLPDDLAHPEAALCHELERRGVTVRHLGLPIMRRAYQNPRGLVALVRRSATLIRRLRRERPDAVYCTTSAAILGAPLARIVHVPTVIGHFQEIWARPDRHLLSLPARTCHHLLAISEAVATSLPPSVRRRTAIVPNGTPQPPQVVPLTGRTGELIFLVASRWNGWKGHRTLFQAWDKAGAPGRLIVLGGPPMSGEAVDVNALATGLHRPESVSIPGEVSDPSSYIETADVVIMPSERAEPFGLVAIEAFARARPVIATAAGGLLEIVTPGVDGWLFPARDASALADILVGLRRDCVESAGAAARATYEERFTVEQFAQRWRQAALASWTTSTAAGRSGRQR